ESFRVSSVPRETSSTRSALVMIDSLHFYSASGPPAGPLVVHRLLLRLPASLEVSYCRADAPRALAVCAAASLIGASSGSPLFPNILKFDLRLHALSVKRHKSRKVRCQHIQQGYAPAAQANETRLTGNPSELGREIHGVLEIADLVE